MHTIKLSITSVFLLFGICVSELAWSEEAKSIPLVQPQAQADPKATQEKSKLATTSPSPSPTSTSGFHVSAEDLEYDPEDDVNSGLVGN